MKHLVDGGSNVTRTLLGNRFTYLQWLNTEPVPNVNLTPEGLLLASQALDNYRELGEYDLLLNYPEMELVNVSGISVLSENYVTLPYTLRLKGMDPGIYFLKIQSPEGLANQIIAVK